MNNFRVGIFYRLTRRLERMRIRAFLFLGLVVESTLNAFKQVGAGLKKILVSKSLKRTFLKKVAKIEVTANSRISKLTELRYVIFLAPLIWIYNTVGSAFSFFLQRVQRILFPPWLKLRFSKVSEKVDDKIVKVTRVKDRLFFKQLTALNDFFLGYLRSRKFELLIQAAPAILLAVPIVYCLVRIPMQSPQKQASRYHSAAIAARESGNIDEASLYYRKIRSLLTESDIYIYEAAVGLAENQQWAEAYDQMKTIANLDEDVPSFVAAHVWIANQLLQGNIQHSEPIGFAETHMKKALIVDPGDYSAISTMANLHAKKGDYDAALSCLKAVQDEAAFDLQRAHFYSRKGDHDLAHKIARKVLKRPRKKDPSPGELIQFAQAQEILGEFVEVQKTMETIEFDSDMNSETKQWIIQYFCRRYDQLDLAKGVFHETQLSVLERAFQLDQTDEETLIRLAQLTRFSNAAGDGARAKLNEIDRTDLPSQVMANMGVAAFMRQDYAEAREVFEVIFKRDSSSAKVANNLAWLLSNQEPLDLNRALEVANRAVQLNQGKNAEHRETRGQILFKLGRFDEAIKDLEFALNGIPENRQILLALSDALEKTGDGHRAEFFRNQANVLK